MIEKKNILYLGSSVASSTSYHRSQALVRLGYSVIIKDPYLALGSNLSSSLLSKLHFNTSYQFVQKKIENWLFGIISTTLKPDLIWVNGGELFGPKALQILKSLDCPIVLYNNDDPTGNRESQRFGSLLKSLPYYDLCAVLRLINVDEYKAKGAKRVLRVCMSYDEVIHQPYPSLADISENFRSEVVFIGTWMRHEKRDEFVLELIRQGLSISIWGDRWNKSPHFSDLEAYWHGSSLGGRNYVSGIQGAKICLGLLSKGNRDLHTRRSVEVPFSGGLLCAERTSEHQAMYTEGVEAVFWSDASECAKVCHLLLQDDSKRESIRLAGMQKVRKLGVGNEDVCKAIIDSVFR